MDFSNNMILRPALDRITSSFASTNNNYGYGGFIDRVLSFTGSFNDGRTSLLHAHDAAAAAELRRATTQTTEDEAAEAEPVLAALADHTFDIEAGTTTTTTTTTPLNPEGAPAPAATDAEAESRRVGKTVQTVCLFVASASLVLFTNLPSNKQQSRSSAVASPGQHAHGGGAAGLLYIADMAFISLGFFCSLGLSMFSVVAGAGSGGSRARVHKWGMVVAVASVVVAFSLRVCMTMPVVA